MTAISGVGVRPVALGQSARTLWAVMAVVLVTFSVGQMVRVLNPDPRTDPPTVMPESAVAGESLAALPMAWAANTGQSDSQVRYQAQGLGYSAFLTDDEAVLRLGDTVLRLGFDSASEAPTLTTEAPLVGTVSSFVGSDPSVWQSAAPTSAVVRYEQLWPGIDATFRGAGTELEWDLHVAAGAVPAAAGMTVTGADRIETDRDHATLVVGESELPLAIPAVWQTGPDGTRIDRIARWELDGDTLRVIPGAWDPDLAGVIDPTLDWSTYLGGGPGGDGNDRSRAIAIDTSGSTYVTGGTGSADFPSTTGAFDTTFDGAEDVFVTKLDPTGTALVYSTLLGGSGVEGDFPGDDDGFGIAVDSTGHAYLTGGTADGATDYPTTVGAYDTTHNGSNDAFVTKLSPTGDALVYSTLLGGSGWDDGTGIAVDSTGHAYLTGRTADGTTDYPTTPGAYDTTHNGGGNDVFVTKLDPTGATLDYSTLLGGTSGDTGLAIALDDTDHVYLTGETFDGTTDWPTTPGAFDTTANGSWDTFATKLDPTGGALVYSTMLGGSAIDFGLSIAVDSADHAYVSGETASFAATAFPTTPGAYDTTPNGLVDAFVTKLDVTGSALDYSTRLGGSGDDRGYGIAVDVTGHAYLTGSTADSFTDHPTTPGAFDTTADGIDAFVTKLDAIGSSLDYSTRLGGSGGDHGFAITVNAAGNAYVTGTTIFGDFPTTPGAYDTTNNGSNDTFVTKLDTTASALDFSTLLGGRDGTGRDAVNGLAADATGVYVTGSTRSGWFPTTTGAFHPTSDTADVFVSKLDPTGSTLIYSTLLGGTTETGYGGIAVDPAGNAYVTGETGATDFPTTPGAFDTTHNGALDAFATKLDATGSTLLYSTFLGGPGFDSARDIALDGSDNVYLTGNADPGFPTTPGAYDTTHVGGFATKLNDTGSALVYSTGLGIGSHAQGVAVDTTGNAYLTGIANPGFPTTPGAYDTTHNGGGGGGDPFPVIPAEDAFAMKLNAAGSALVYSTLIGASDQDRGNGIAVDSAGNAYLTGETVNAAPPYPTTASAYDTSHNGQSDAFVTKLNPTGSALTYSTFLGGGSSDSGARIAVDPAGYAYLVGYTIDAPTDYPTTANGYDPTHNGSKDAFVTRLSPSGGTIDYSTFIGGTYVDEARGMALTTAGSIAVGGSTLSSDLPTTPGAFDTTNVHALEAGFVTMLELPTVVPGAPTIGTATAGNQSATVSWTAPGFDGGSAITGYVVTPYIGYFPLAPQVFSSAATTQVVTGLTNGTQYRFRVQAVNAVGTGGYSKVTNPVTLPTVPGAPTIGTAVVGNGEATVSWTAPGFDGGATITGYVVTPYIGYFPLSPQVFSSAATTQVVTGLTNGTQYRFRVQAVNAVGIGGYSKVTNPVTPTA